jgi:hypothetical protein
MYYLNSQRTLCHILEDVRTGEAPDPCGIKARKFDLLRYRDGRPGRILPEKPPDIPLCQHCQKAEALVGRKDSPHAALVTSTAQISN